MCDVWCMMCDAWCIYVYYVLWGVWLFVCLLSVLLLWGFTTSVQAARLLWEERKLVGGLGARRTERQCTFGLSSASRVPGPCMAWETLVSRGSYSYERWTIMGLIDWDTAASLESRLKYKHLGCAVVSRHCTLNVCYLQYKLQTTNYNGSWLLYRAIAIGSSPPPSSSVVSRRWGGGERGCEYVLPAYNLHPAL